MARLPNVRLVTGPISKSCLCAQTRFDSFANTGMHAGSPLWTSQDMLLDSTLGESANTVTLPTPLCLQANVTYNLVFSPVGVGTAIMR